MGWFSAPEYWLGRLALERGTAIIYLIAFVAAAQQFRPLIGEHGMLPVPRYLAGQSFWRTPSIFHFRYSDRVFAGVCWLGAVLSAAVVAGAASFVPLWATMLIWLTLWVLYLSIVNVGQAWYSFGWESLLLETGFLMIFLGNERTAPPILTLLLARWPLFRPSSARSCLAVAISTTSACRCCGACARRHRSSWWYWTTTPTTCASRSACIAAPG